MSIQETNTQAPVRCAIVGLGGFAAFHHRALLNLEASGRARLVATCDPRPEDFATERALWRFEQRRVRVFPDYEALLDACAPGLDLVVIATPIALHARMHRLAVSRGVPVYLEKPPTLDPAELETMIECDRSAAKATLVGFNFMVERPRLALKARLVAGEFGKLREVRLLGLRPRASGYFQRNDWAGRLLTRDGGLLLDSCFANALAHYVHNTLFWAGGPTVPAWPALHEARAALYRGHLIEGADTFFTEALTKDGIVLRAALTHACHDVDQVRETLLTDKAELHYIVGSHWEVRWKNGLVQREKLPPFDMLELLTDTHLEYHRYLRGFSRRPSSTLNDCRPFVQLNGLSYLSSGEITPFPATISQTHGSRENTTLHIEGLAEALTRFLTSGLWPWDSPTPRAARPSELGRLREHVANWIREDMPAEALN